MMRAGVTGVEARMRAAMVQSDTIRCARCGHCVGAEAWRSQPVERTLTHVDLGAYVSGWPGDSVVEVRGCTKCGGSIARRVKRTAAA